MLERKREEGAQKEEERGEERKKGERETAHATVAFFYGDTRRVRVS